MNRIKERRLELGLTQKQIAEISGVPASSLNEVEHGKTIPNVLNAIRIAQALECTVEYLFSPDL